MQLEEINRLIEKFGENVITDMKDELERNGSLATGFLYQSINYNYTSTIEQMLIQFVSEDYATFIEQGRSAGKYAPVSKIMQWCEELKGFAAKSGVMLSIRIFTSLE